jgi:hypothetical protein
VNASRSSLVADNVLSLPKDGLADLKLEMDSLRGSNKELDDASTVRGGELMPSRIEPTPSVNASRSSLVADNVLSLPSLREVSSRRNDVVNTIKQEFESLRERMEMSVVRAEPGAEKDEIRSADMISSFSAPGSARTILMSMRSRRVSNSCLMAVSISTTYVSRPRSKMARKMMSSIPSNRNSRAFELYARSHHAGCRNAHGVRI